MFQSLAKYPTQMLLEEIRRRRDELTNEIDGFELGSQLKYARLSKGMNQTKFAEYVGFSLSSVNQAENGSRPGTARKILEMLQRKDSSPSALCGGKSGGGAEIK